MDQINQQKQDEVHLSTHPITQLTTDKSQKSNSSPNKTNQTQTRKKHK